MRPLEVVRFSAMALSGHGLRTTLSLVGISIGVMSVVVLTAIGEGARRYVIDEFASLGSNVLIVVPGRVETTGGIPGYGGTENDLTLDDTQAIRRAIPRIRRIAPVATGTEVIAQGQLSRSIAVIGTTPDFQELRDIDIAAGQFLPEEELDRGTRVCVIGSRVQQELFASTFPIGQVVRIGGWRFRVVGVLAKRGESLGVNMDDLVIVPVATCLKMFNKSSLFRIMIDTGGSGDLESLKQEVLDVIVPRHDDVEDVTLITQDAILTTFTQILAALTAVLVGIAAISLSVAGIGIMNVMLVTISERTHEVGLMKAIGATSRQIMLIFLTEATVISLCGGILGLGIGYAATIAFMRVIPGFDVTPPLWAAATAVIVSVLVGCIFGVLPARKAARLDPIVALSGGRP